jgi:hypothetical protein
MVILYLNFLFALIEMPSLEDFGLLSKWKNLKELIENMDTTLILLSF